jgi:SRSO17 transposase
METVELRAAAKKLNRLHERFASWFGRVENQRHSLGYLRGLLLAEGRKSVEPMALMFGGPEGEAPAIEQATVLAWQRFLTTTQWEAAMIQREIQAVFNEELVPSARRGPIGTVGVIDESCFPKSGKESVGVQRQWCGRLGKTENCQVGVFLVGVTPDGTALLDHQLFLPEHGWADNPARRKKTHVPREIRFQTKPQIAVALWKRSQVRFDWVIADEAYGRNGEFLDALEAGGQRYLMEVPSDTTAWVEEPTQQTPDERVRQVRDIAADLPASAWQWLKLREGTKGPLVFAFARLRAWAVRHRRAGPPMWLLFRRSAEGEVKYYVSNAEENTPLETLGQVSGSRWRVEEFFEDGKMHLGMTDYEARSWTSWHRHMCLVALAHLFVTQTRREAQSAIPDLTLDMALRIVRSVMERPTLSFEDALELIKYHSHRNSQAHKSHRKSWLDKHKRIAKKVTL